MTESQDKLVDIVAAMYWGSGWAGNLGIFFWSPQRYFTHEVPWRYATFKRAIEKQTKTSSRVEFKVSHLALGNPCQTGKTTVSMVYRCNDPKANGDLQEYIQTAQQGETLVLDCQQTNKTKYNGSLFQEFYQKIFQEEKNKFENWQEIQKKRNSIDSFESEEYGI